LSYYYCIIKLVITIMIRIELNNFFHLIKDLFFKMVIKFNLFTEHYYFIFNTIMLVVAKEKVIDEVKNIKYY